MREDKSYIGGGDLEIKSAKKELYIEVGLFILISILCLVFFFTHTELIKGYLKAGRFLSLLGVLLVVLLLPFGPHLFSRIITFIFGKLK